MDGKDLKKELELTRQKADEYLNGWKRAKADYANYKKDVEKRQQEIIQFANAKLIADLLPIYEHFRRALQHAPSDEKKGDWQEGLWHILRQFQNFLKNLGIEEIKTVGEIFNPELHEAVKTVAQEGIAAQTVTEEVQAGYTLHGKVVIPAKVKVAK